MNTLGLVLVGIGVLLAVGGIVVMIVGRRAGSAATDQSAMAPPAQAGYPGDWAADDRGGRAQAGSAMVVGALLAGVGVVLAVSGGVMSVMLADDPTVRPGHDVVAAGDRDDGDPSEQSTVAPTGSAGEVSTVTSTVAPDEVSTVTSTVAPDEVPPVDDRGGAARSSGDLGLAAPMSRPSCDGRGIVVLYSAVTPGAYASEIRTALANNPGASYLRTDQACPSLRPRDDNGNVIYAVYRESGYSHAQLCADVAVAPAGSYGRWLDLTSDPSQLVQC